MSNDHFTVKKDYSIFEFFKKHQGCYPWTYLNPQDIQEVQEPLCQRKIINRGCVADDCRAAHRAHHHTETETATAATANPTIEKTEHISTIHEPVVVVPTSLLPELSSPSHDLLSFNFDNIDTQRAIDSYSTKSSVKNSSSGILEVLQDLEAEEERENERKRNQSQVKPSTTTQSNQDLSTYKPKEESKRFAFRSLLKRTHSAPKKIQLTKNQPNIDPEQPQSPTQVQCCHPIVEKLKTMADKHVHKSKSAAAPKKPSTKTTTIKTVPLPNEKKIVLAEQTRIIRLKGSPKAERKNVAAYLEKRDSDDIVEIMQLDESPSETRKRREENRKLDEQDDSPDKKKEKENETKKAPTSDDNEKEFIVPQNLTGLNTEPTVEELLEEEFKNDPPKKAPRKVKEHIYEEIDQPGAITSHRSAKLGKPANIFACAVLHSVLNKDEFKESLQRQNEIEDIEEAHLAKDQSADAAAAAPETVTDTPVAATNQTSEISTISATNEEKPIPEEIIEIKATTADEADETAAHRETDQTNEKDQPPQDAVTKVDDDDGESREKAENADEASDSVSKLDSDLRKDVLVKEEKKVTFSQSTEEYQDKLAAEKGPEKEDVELPANIKVSKRWSNMRSVC